MITVSLEERLIKNGYVKNKAWWEKKDGEIAYKVHTVKAFTYLLAIKDGKIDNKLAEEEMRRLTK